MDGLARQVPLVTLSGVVTLNSASVRGDNAAGMCALVRHLIHDHGYRTLAYLAGDADSTDNADRRNAAAAEAGAAGIELIEGRDWQGSYYVHGGAQVVGRLIAQGNTLPRVVICANDLAALGVMRALTNQGIAVPRDVAVTGYDDIPLARRLRPSLTTVSQPIQELGGAARATIFGVMREFGDGRLS